MKEKPITYTTEEFIKGIDEETKKHYTILHYLLNKNSRPFDEGGVNHEKLFDELQDYEEYLLDSFK